MLRHLPQPGDQPGRGDGRLRGGKPSKRDYRKFAIKTVEGNNDFASLQEVLRRRFKRAKESLRALQAAQSVDALVPVDEVVAGAGEAVEMAVEQAAPVDEKAASGTLPPGLVIHPSTAARVSSVPPGKCCANST
ncbi:MAG: hypothetical protein U0232_23860 [Thermomicrobiales bacterium]